MDLYTKAAELGIQTDFLDGTGHSHKTDAAALKIILDALPVRTGRRFLDRAIVLRAGDEWTTSLNDTAILPVRWTISAGSEPIAEGRSATRAIQWPDHLPSGVHRVRLIDAAYMSEDAPLIVAPRAAFAGEFERSWLLALQLYSLRSARNWGIGDFTDLETMIGLAAEFGAAGVGLNPLHALFEDRPGDCSPYSPNSRLFLNPLYIDVAKLPGVEPDDDDQAVIGRLREARVVDYAGVSKLKHRALRQAFEVHRASPDPAAVADFEAFRAERAPLLSRFACFEVLRRSFGQPWWDWPAEWQHCDDARCDALRAGAEADEIAFVEYVQWVADRQLRACRDLAARRGMTVGLYLDIAVGVQSDGFDAWVEQIAISRHLAVGAPPDPLNTAGQNWGLAGFNAAGLEVQSFAPFRDMLRASMRYAGAVRLDHVLGLQRLYLVPHGFDAKDGVYVQMPFEALLAVTAQESLVGRCVVIGEDLGTVPDGFRDALGDWGIWSYRVMMFEQDFHSRAFFGIEHYPANALITFNTHDLATYAGWRSLSDLTTKRAIGIDPGESDDSRRYTLAMLSEVLGRHDIGSDHFHAVTEFMARTPARLLAIALEDLLGVLDQPNIPGTVNEHPNWRQRLPVAIEEIATAVDVPALRLATGARAPRDA